jgi:hypothetical protein
LLAIQNFFTSCRFMGDIYEGEVFPPISGIGDAFRSGDIMATFQAMTDSMTDQLRSNFSDPAVVTGRSAQAIIYVEFSEFRHGDFDNICAPDSLEELDNT